MTDFDNETALESAGEGRWSGRVSGKWNIGDAPNGGYLVCIAMQAIRQLSPQHQDPLTVTAHYLRTGIPNAPCEVRAESLRVGRTVSTARATLSQEGKSRLEVLAGFGDLSQTGDEDAPSLQIPAPEMPTSDECPQRSAEEQGVALPLLERLDIRIHPDEVRAGSAGEAQVSGWIRLADGQSPDSLTAVLFADAFPPSVFGLLGNIGWVPTLELTVHVRRRPSPGWVLGQLHTRDLKDGRMVEDGYLWDSNGELLAQSRQIALLLPRS
ncbi:MAG TPA: TesB-like acyl-CoA thioesterase 3 [Gammaproteobacteria bacterium]|nr:TesB-like acyl-CoA thioesterase 3 [Gammaproteobacteria bacterium]|tara:strand:+ start:589 stop:1392 length:804 start_codon:yes stop_codon:yes gene_type:complete